MKDILSALVIVKGYPLVISKEDYLLYQNSLHSQDSTIRKMIEEVLLNKYKHEYKHEYIKWKF